MKDRVTTPPRRFVLTLALAWSLGVFLLAHAHAQSVLYPGQSLTLNQSLTSENGRYVLAMQADGNLVLYRTSDWQALWASDTYGSAVSQAVMQYDGNFVIYGYYDPLWASHTDGRPGAYLALQNDGNAVIYQPNVPVWASDTYE